MQNYPANWEGAHVDPSGLKESTEQDQEPEPIEGPQWPSPNLRSQHGTPKLSSRAS